MHTLLFLDPSNFHAALTLRAPPPRAADRIVSTPAGARSVGTSSRSWSGSTGALGRLPAGVPPSYGDGLDYRGHAELAYRTGPVTAHVRTRWERAPGPGGGDAPGRPAGRVPLSVWSNARARAIVAACSWRPTPRASLRGEPVALARP